MVAPLEGESVRYGVIGTGMMGCEHLLNLAHVPGVSVVALSDPDPGSRELGVACAGTGPDAEPVAAYADHRSLLERDDLDVVVIASPNHTHLAVLEDVLAADVHVMVEKPLCTTVDDALRVARLADGRTSAGRPLLTWVALEYRFMPTPEALVAATERGDVGQVRMVSIREHRFPFLRKVGDWNRLSARTGGTLVEKCCHFFDLMRLLAGADPVRVLASGGQDVNHLDEWVADDEGRLVRSDLLDNAFVIVEFANGARGALDLCMFAEGGRFEQELTVVGDEGKLETTVPGEVVWLGRRPPFGESPSAPVPIEAPLADEVAYQGFHHGSSYREHLRFLEQIRAGAPPLVTVDDGVWSVAMGAAAHRSIDERRPVDLDELLTP